MSTTPEQRLAAAKSKAAISLVEVSQTQSGYIAQRWAIGLRFETLEELEAWVETLDAKGVTNE